MNKQIKKTAKAIPLDANSRTTETVIQGEKRMNCDYPVLEGAPTRQCYICKCKEQPRALHVDLGAIWLCDNCKAKMEEQDIKQIEEMMRDLDAIYHPNFKRDYKSGLRDITERLYNTGYRKQEWISVEDRLPTWKDGKVLIYTTHGISIAQRTTSERWKGDCAIPKLITHWMPLPTPPKAKGGAE